jgi:hypothetical protein
MANDKLKDGMSFIIILLIVGIVVGLIYYMGIEVSNSPHAELSSSSEAYLTEITSNSSALGFDTSIYGEKQDGALSGEAGDNKNEFALDFNFGRRKANGISSTIYKALNVPEFIIIDLFKLPKNNFKWVVDLFDWLWRIFMFWAIVAFIRGNL